VTWYSLKSLSQTSEVEVTIKPLLVGLKICSIGETPSESKYLNARKVENDKNISSMTCGSFCTSIRADVQPLSGRAHTFVCPLLLIFTLLHTYYKYLITMFPLFSDFPSSSFYSAAFSSDCYFLQNLFSCPHVFIFKVLSSTSVSHTFVKVNIFSCTLNFYSYSAI
jgi:hypothetical protein